jgi:hypothetical protein
MLTQARLKEVLDYDPASGVFLWRVKIRSIRPGRVAGAIAKGFGYRVITVDQTRHYAHRLAWLYVHGEWPNGDLDHENLDRADNRIANLREASVAQNRANARPSRNNKSGLKGAYFVKARGKWCGSIFVDGKTKNLGYFATAEEAHAAYAAAARKHFGKFARNR